MLGKEVGTEQWRGCGESRGESYKTLGERKRRG